MRNHKKSTSSSHRKKSLPDHVELAIGAKVLVTQNIKTDLDIPNGARGKIVKIVFDPREPEFEENCSVVELEYMPLYELVKMDCTRAQKLDGRFGLEEKSTSKAQFIASNSR
ncbi:uncharacterized protein C8R40DRAFT_1110806 [Lentinula edodes]|uniref:uncharacterized protein n=1 Tax=Lentinula edodes TaxID=5353 RepID=UPI001E8CD29F|nr:uncharacterized protein C8R40DRAFT_1110806 [Lentinula edodes]KAH7874014.1 hypothetical protein C8R40DRAFT_1110806 [Lentinula edodes]